MSRRRKLLKALSIASAPAAIWTPPLVRSVVLPAHARTSLDTVSGGILIECNVEDTGRVCSAAGIEFRVFGTVSGVNLDGAVLIVRYLNELENRDGLRVVTTTTVVEPGNTFDVTVQAFPPTGDFWADLTGLVTVQFEDIATFGFVECTSDYTCRPVPE